MASPASPQKGLIAEQKLIDQAQAVVDGQTVSVVDGQLIHSDAGPWYALSVADGELADIDVVTVAGAPTIGAATAGDAEASVAFTAPVSDGGTPITGYEAVSTPGSITGTGTASPITVEGLTNDTEYTFKVRAINGVGNSALSAASNAVTPVAA